MAVGGRRRSTALRIGLREEAGDGAIAMMRAIKRALDPDDIMNPGKIFER